MIRELTSKLRSLESTYSISDKIEISLDSDVETSFVKGQGHIVINPKLDLYFAFLLVARFGVLTSKNHIHPLEFQPYDALLYNRVCRANTDVSIFRTAWEANLKGWSKPMEAMLENQALGKSMAKFKEIAQEDFRTLRTGAASYFAFEEWFDGLMVDYSDINLVGTLMMLDKARSKRALPQSEVLRIGQYAETNYLSPMMGTLMTHPFYRSVRNPKVANFLTSIGYKKEEIIPDGGDDAA